MLIICSSDSQQTGRHKQTCSLIKNQSRSGTAAEDITLQILQTEKEPRSRSHLIVTSLPRLLRVSPALPVPARSGKLPREECALAAPQASHDGRGRQSCTPGRRIVLRLVSEGGGGASHDAAGSGGSALMKERGRQRGHEHAQRTVTQTQCCCVH